MSKFNKLFVVLLALPVLAFATPVMAANFGQIEGGDIYRVKNVTKSIASTDPVNADACDVLMYSVRVHDPGPASLTNVWVQAYLPDTADTSNTSYVMTSAVDASPALTQDTATVNLSSRQAVSYIPGSTKLLDANAAFLSNLPDGVTQGGINIGNVGVSIDNKRFVTFQAKVSCPAPTPVTPAVVTPTATPTPTPAPKVVTASAPVATATKALPNTGAGDVLSIFAGTSAVGTAGHYFISRRRK